MAGTIGIQVKVIFNNIPAYAAQLSPGIAEDIATTAYEIEAESKRLAPVLTGTLRRSIHTVFSNGGLTAVVGPSVFYSVFVEFGTRFRSARPYMRPAAAKCLPRLIPRIQKRLRAA